MALRRAGQSLAGRLCQSWAPASVASSRPAFLLQREVEDSTPSPCTAAVPYRGVLP